MIKETDLGYRWVVVYEYTYYCGDDDYYSQYLPVGIEKIRFKRKDEFDKTGHSSSIFPTDKKFIINQTWCTFDSFEQALEHVKNNKEDNDEASKILINAVNNYRKFMESIDNWSNDDVEKN